MKTILCLAHSFKGAELLREAARLGCQTILLTRQEHIDQPWPWEALSQTHALESLEQAPERVLEIARETPISLVFPLHERDVERAARLRELLCLPGMDVETALTFRDKLAMREISSQAGVANPPFVHLLHTATVRDFLRRVPPPWMVKPRSEAGALGILKVHSADELWKVARELGDEASGHLVEACVEGDVFHVDSLVHRGKIRFVQAHRYGTPPFEVWNHGGVFSSFSLPADDPVASRLLRLNERVLRALRLEDGVSHVEFLGGERGELMFLEAAARVAGANLDVLVEKASGVSLWREWLKMELQGSRYRAPRRRYDSAALLQCLSRQQHPELRELRCQELVWTLQLANHAGLILASANAERVRQLAARARTELERDHLAVLQPLKRPPTVARGARRRRSLVGG